MDPRPSLTASLLRGSLGFAAVSLGGFAPWAFGGRYFTQRIGEGGMYAVCGLVFLALTGLLLHPLVAGKRRFLRFHVVFVPAFFAYAVAWCAAWFAFTFHGRDWIGSFAGSVAFAAVTLAILGNVRALPKVAAALFVTHSAGYFGGGILHGMMSGIPAMLAWGLGYGLGFGAGIGYAFHAAQKETG